MDSVAESDGEQGGRREEDGGDRYQTISADHHNIGGSTAVLLVEHRTRPPALPIRSDQIGLRKSPTSTTTPSLSFYHNTTDVCHPLRPLV